MWLKQVNADKQRTSKARCAAVGLKNLELTWPLFSGNYALIVVSAIHSRSHIKPHASATRKLIVRAGLSFSADGGEVCRLRRNLTPPVREFMDVTVRPTSLETMNSTDRTVCTLAEYFSAGNNSRQSLVPAGRFTASPAVLLGDAANNAKEEDFGRTVAIGAGRSGAAGASGIAI